MSSFIVYRNGEIYYFEYTESVNSWNILSELSNTMEENFVFNVCYANIQNLIYTFFAHIQYWHSTTDIASEQFREIIKNEMESHGYYGDATPAVCGVKNAKLIYGTIKGTIESTDDQYIDIELDDGGILCFDYQENDLGYYKDLIADNTLKENWIGEVFNCGYEMDEHIFFTKEGKEEAISYYFKKLQLLNDIYNKVGYPKQIIKI